MAVARPPTSPGKRTAGRPAPPRPRTSPVARVLVADAAPARPGLTEADVAAYNAEMAR